ncbi:MAG: hypothetical protein ACO1SX_25685 [Actinomycetota bacterium]
MELTRELLLVAAERAEVYPPGNGFSFFVGAPESGCGGVDRYIRQGGCALEAG